MHRILRRRQNWTCARCYAKRIARSNSSAATASATTFTKEEPSQHDLSFYRNNSGVSDELTSDHKLLRDVFNNKALWRDFSQQAKKSAGLIGNRYLTDPGGFKTFTEASLQKCKALVDRTLAASTPEELRNIPRDLDQLSDHLCRVIDLADFIRNIHPDQRMVTAATASYSMMYQYMNELNTATGLHDQLRKMMSDSKVVSQLTTEERMVAGLLMKDFTKSGVHMPAQQRAEFVSLSNDIAAVGTDFMNNAEHAVAFVDLSKTQLRGIDPTYLQKMSAIGKTRIPVYSPASKMVSRCVHDPAVRERMYIADRTASRSTIARLESLLMHRAQLAHLTGYETYGHLHLQDKMSKSPDAVMKFLTSLYQNNKEQVRSESSKLLQTKRLTDPDARQVNGSEHSYLLNRIQQLEKSKATHNQATGNLPRTSVSRLRESRSAYFALGHVIQGLSSLFSRLYGIRLVPKETALGETWHPDVRRLDVYTEAQQHVATMYCDLFTRPDKRPNPAHYTLVCSRELSPEDMQTSLTTGEPLNDGMPTYTTTNPVTGKVSHHQIPIIALVCDFDDNRNKLEPSLLSQHAVTTLFHEMGHAVHSFLGRTSMQGIAGTRCATDFAELPSVLMEYFATNASVLKLFARHWQTDRLIPDEMIEGMATEQQSRAESSGGWENEIQILMAILDQTYHGRGPVDAMSSGRFDSTATFHQVWQTYASFPEPANTSWQGFFGHLFGYGSSYYSYLFDRAIARQVWRVVFNNGDGHAAIDREGGERFKEEVLKWGGGRDPWICLEGLMGEEKGILAGGGEEAMNLVGGWGVGAGEEGMM